MARRPDVRYVQLYTVGSAARKIQPQAPLPKLRMPKVQKQRKITVRIDPIATLGVITAVVMFVLMGVGVMQLRNAKQEQIAMEQYVLSLQADNAALQSEYATGYDLAEVEKTALALGMVAKEQVVQVPIHVSAEETVEQTPDFWDRVSVFLTGLFA